MRQATTPATVTRATRRRTTSPKIWRPSDGWSTTPLGSVWIIGDPAAMMSNSSRGYGVIAEAFRGEPRPRPLPARLTSVSETNSRRAQVGGRAPGGQKGAPRRLLETRAPLCWRNACQPLAPRSQRHWLWSAPFFVRPRCLWSHDVERALPRHPAQRCRKSRRYCCRMGPDDSLRRTCPRPPPRSSSEHKFNMFAAALMFEGTSEYHAGPWAILPEVRRST